MTHGSEILTCKNKFLLQLELLLVVQIFTMVINVWPHANWTMVTNNIITVIDVTLTDVTLMRISCI